MVIYNYDENGVYTFESEADESPLEEGVFLFPANSTEKKPFTVGKNEACVFENGEWVLKPDFRGFTYWTPDKKEHTIKNVGVEIPNGVFDSYDSIPLTEDETREELIIKAKHYLAETDWYYTRKQETGKEVPTDVYSKRIEMRELINELGG